MSILADGWSLVNSAGEVISEALGLGDGDDSGGAMGSLRYILVEGDPLVGETGIILPVGRSSPALTGIPVAFIGDMVQCYTCGQIKPIEKDGGPYRVGIFSGDVDISVFDIVNATEEFAYENDVIYCACGKKPLQAVLAPVQQAKDIEDAPTAAMLSGLKRELGEGWELTKAEVGSWTYGGISSGIHIGLGAAGAIPVLGVVPDVVDAVYTSGEAIFSEHSSGADAAMAWGAVGASIIPGVDQAADAAKIAKRTADAADLVHDAGVAADAQRAAKVADDIPHTPHNNKPAPCSSVCAIVLASGEEKIPHHDFTLSGAYPLVFERLYNSSFHYYDDGVFGARWTSDYTTKLRVTEEGLTYYGGDARRQVFPTLEVGQSHYNDIERVQISRTPENQIILVHDKTRTETYDLAYSDQGDYYRLSKITIKNQGETILKYNHFANGLEALSGIIAQANTPFEQHIQTVLNDDGRITELHLIRDTQPVRTLAHYVYDDAGDLVKAIDEHGQAYTYQYDHHLVTRYTDRNGMGVNLEYNGIEHNSRAIHEWSDDGTMENWLSWDDDRNIVSFSKGGKDQPTQYFNDPLGYTYLIIHPDGREEHIKRDAQKRVVEHIRPDGSIERSAYVGDNLTAITHPDRSQVRFSYDNRDNLTAITDPLGNHWQRIYDQSDRIITQIDPLGHSTHYEYNDQNQLIRTINANQGESTLTYNKAGLLTEHTDCSNQRTTWHYDAHNRLISKTNAAGETTRYSYADTAEQFGRINALIRPDGTTEQVTLNGEGQLAQHTDALKRSTRYVYGLQGKVLTRTDANANRLSYQYDKAGRLTRLENENQSHYTFEYDPSGKLLIETDFAGQANEYRYDEHGVLTGILNKPHATNIELDVMGRLIRKSSIKALDDSTITIPLTDRFEYDALGRLIKATNADATIEWSYDAAGRLTSETQTHDGQTHVWQHQYNALNTRIKTTRPDGSTIDWLTYGGGHVHGILWNGEELIGFERDSLHRETTRTQANSVTQSRQYDAVGRLKSQHIAQAGQTLNQRAYNYDAAGQLTHISDQRRGELAYSYDPVGRLLQANSALGEELFAFDPAGNISDSMVNTVDKSSEPNAVGWALPTDADNQSKANKVLDNLLKQYVGTHYTYDALGNMTERLHNGVKTTFEWDSNNRMTASETNGKRTTYAYDPLGRRIAKTTDGQTTIYGWDGDTLAFEQTDINGATQTKHYVYEANSFVPLMQIVKRTNKVLTTADGEDEQDEAFNTETIAYYQNDHLGTPQELTGDNGDVVWSANYKAWGEAKAAIDKAAQAAGIDNKLRFQGQYLDEETGLHYNRHRYYDPHSGRFVSQDPIKLAGGNNLQAYAPNPTMWVDPLGLAGNPADATHITYEGIKNGQPYVGYASMPGLGQNPQDVLDYRYSGNYDVFDRAPAPIYSGDGQAGKNTARGLEQRTFEGYGGLDGTSNLQNPVGANNPNRDAYLNAADEHLSGGCCLR